MRTIYLYTSVNNHPKEYPVVSDEIVKVCVDGIDVGMFKSVNKRREGGSCSKCALGGMDIACSCAGTDVFICGKTAGFDSVDDMLEDL